MIHARMLLIQKWYCIYYERKIDFQLHNAERKCYEIEFLHITFLFFFPNFLLLQFLLQFPYRHPANWVEPNSGKAIIEFTERK